MLAPLKGPLVFTQNYGSLKGGPGEAYTAEHVIAGQVVTVQCPAHPGYDLACANGSPVYVMKGGLLRWPGPDEGYSTALGLYAVITTAEGEEFWYAHLSRQADLAGVVAAGALLGYSGYSGNVVPAGPAGAHLHLAKRPAHPDYHAFDGFVPFLHQFNHDLYDLMDFSRL